MGESTAMTMADILTSITSIVTSAISWLTQVVTAVTSQPILLLFVVFGFVGTGIGIFRRLTR